MKKHVLFPVLCLCLALTPVVSRAEGGKHKPADTELGRSMETLGKAWRQLRKQAPDPAQNADSLALLATIKDAVKNNLNFTPDLARDVPADKRDKFIAGYQAKMKETSAVIDQIESALKANDNKTAVELIAKADALKKEGHKEYKRPE